MFEGLGTERKVTLDYPGIRYTYGYLLYKKHFFGLCYMWHAHGSAPWVCNTIYKWTEAFNKLCAYEYGQIVWRSYGEMQNDRVPSKHFFGNALLTSKFSLAGFVMFCAQLLPVSNVFRNIPDATNIHYPLVPTVIKSGPILVPLGYWFSHNECFSNLFQVRKSITLYDIARLYKLRSTNF